MERLRNLIRSNPDLLSDQMALECLMVELDEEQAERLARILVAYMRMSSGHSLRELAAPVFH